MLLRKNGDWGDTTILLTSGGVFHKWGKGNIVIHGVPKGQNEKLAIYRSVHSERKKEKKTGRKGQINESTHPPSQALRDPCPVEVPLRQVHAIATSPCPYAQPL